MGILSHDPHIQHFSHPHLLELTNSQIPCSACKLPSSGWMYTCKNCINFALHESCTQMPQLITHLSHPSHHLSLLPTPIYPGGLFNCDGCGNRGNGFSYNCNNCDFDLHMLCETKTMEVTHHSHSHKLHLTFDPPYKTKGFSCDICENLEVITGCIAAVGVSLMLIWIAKRMLVQPGLFSQPQAQVQAQRVQIQHYNSFPGVYQNLNPAQCLHSQSMEPLPMQNNIYQSPAATVNHKMNAAVQGFIGEAARQVVQTFVQSLTNDGGNNVGSSCAPGNNNGRDSTSIIDIGSSIINGIFGDSLTQN